MFGFRGYIKAQIQNTRNYNPTLKTQSLDNVPMDKFKIC